MSSPDRPVIIALSVFAGALILTALVHLFPPAASGEFGAAIWGAAVGGIITVAMQIVALRAAAGERQQDALEKRRSLAYALLFKMIRITSNFDTIDKHLQQSLARGHPEPGRFQQWQLVLPIANVPEFVHFSTDEMAVLLALKDNDLFNNMAALDSVHNATLSVLQKYSEMRNALTSLLPGAHSMEGNLGTTYLTEEQVRFLMPRCVELNSIIDQLFSDCGRDAKSSFASMARLNSLLNEKVQLGIQLSPKANAQEANRTAAAR